MFISLGVGFLLQGLISQEWNIRLPLFSGAAWTAVLLAHTIWDRYGWRHPFAQKWTPAPRDIRGTWKGRLASDWVDPATDLRIPEKDAYLAIDQTFSQASVLLLTNESRSLSSLAAVDNEGGEHRLNYLFMNEPSIDLQHRSPIHRGATSLIVSGNPPVRMEGSYWTARNTKGRLTFTSRVATLAGSYEEAQRLF